MRTSNAPLAVVTGVSSRLGYALAERCAAGGFDLLVAAGDDRVDEAARRLRDHGGLVEPVRLDPGDPESVDELHDIARVLGRPVEALIAGPSRLSGAAFLDQAVDAVVDTFDLGLLASVRLAHRIGGDMRERRRGRMLIACAPAAREGSAALRSGANAFLAAFAVALRQELAPDGVSVTCLPPQAGCAVAEAAASPPEARAAAIARLGFDAMMRGDLGLAAGAAAAIAAAAG